MARVLGYGGLANTNGARTFSGKAAASTDNFDDRLRDGTYRRRYSGLMMASVLLLLLAGCAWVQPPRPEVYDCLRPDYGDVLPPEGGCR